jgi:hypothetical protein
MTVKNSKRAYNLNVKVNTVRSLESEKGEQCLEADVVVHLHNRRMKRIVRARGRAINAVKDRLIIGNDTWIRCLFEKTEDLPEGECLIAIGIPNDKFKEKAA